MAKSGNLKIAIPSQGGLQFLTLRKEMLDIYDKAKIQSKKDKVQTKHGNVAEAAFRKWLGDFLPKKYAVTSGYIISQGVAEGVKAPHFDVIIYNQLEAPVLWVEESFDSSSQGKSRAIPAEYVQGIIEVKSSFENSTVKAAIAHLAELEDLMSGEDSPEERYKIYLPPNFFCSTLFFELRKENEFDKAALGSLVNGINLKSYFPGIILRGEGFARDYTGELKLLLYKESITSNIVKPSYSMLSGNTPEADTVQIDSKQVGSMLIWNETHFSRFAFNIVA